MALTKVVKHLSSTPSIVDGGNATAITIDSSENTLFHGHVDLGDNQRIRFGDSDDYHISHNANGVTYVAGNVVEHNANTWRLKNLAGTETIINALGDGAVSLYHNGSSKLETTSSGITVTGTITGALASNVTATTQSATDNSTKIATTAYTDAAITALVGGAPSTLDTLNEIAASINDDANYVGTVNNLIAAKAPLDSPVFSSTYTGGQDESLAEFRRDGGAVAAKIIYADATTDMEFGTTTAHSISLITGDTRRIKIDNAGNVNIGALAIASATTAPLMVAKASTDVQAIFGDNNASIDDPSIRIIGRNTANNAVRYTFLGLDADANHGYLGYNAGAGGFVNALKFDTSGRVGINQTPLTNNFALQVTGLGGGSGDARVVYLKGSGAHTSIGSTGPTLTLQNTNNTANNIVKLSFESASSGETVSINAINTNHSSHYGDMAFNTRGSAGYSEKMRIMANGNVGIGTSNPQRKLVVYQGDSGQAQIQFQNVTTGSAAADGFGVGLDSAEKGFIWNYEGNNTYIGGAGGTFITIQNDGKVGIGIELPAAKFNVVGDSGTAVVESIRNPNTGWGQYALTRYGTEGSDVRYMDFGYYRGSTEATRGLVVKSQANATLATFLDSGNVGIGTAAPPYQLSMKHASGPTLMMTRTSTNTSGSIGRIIFGNNDWDSSMASICAVQDGTNDGGKLEFKTQSDASGGEQTRLTIFRSGLSTFNGPASSVNLGGGSTASAALYVNSTSGHVGEMFQLLKNGSNRLTILNNGQATFAGKIVSETTDSQFYNRLFIKNGNDGIYIGQWDGSNHRIEADASRPLTIQAYNSNGIYFGLAGNNKVQIVGAQLKLSTDIDLVQTVSSGGGDYHHITHSGNEAWSWGARSGSGSDDYLDVGISGGTKAMSWHENGKVMVGPSTTATSGAKLEVRGFNETEDATDADDATGAEEPILMLRGANGGSVSEWVHSTKAVAPGVGTQTAMISWYRFDMPGGWSGTGTPGFLEIHNQMSGMHASGSAVEKFFLNLPNEHGNISTAGGLQRTSISRWYAYTANVGAYTTSLSTAFYYGNSSSFGYAAGAIFMKVTHASREPFFTMYAKYIGGTGASRNYPQKMHFLGTESTNNHAPSNISALSVHDGRGML